MTQANPYQTPGQLPGYEQPVRPSRTSGMAVTSLILGILAMITCCVPYLGTASGALGAVLGVMALVFIGGAMGRLTGKGLAITGLICSILGLVFNLAIVVAMTAGLKMFSNYGQVIAVAQGDDQIKLVGMLDAGTAASVTPEDMARFKKDSLDAVGKFQRYEGGVGNLLSAAMKMGALGPAGIPAKYQGGSGGAQPVPAMVHFEKGEALVIFVLDSQSGQQDPQLPAGKVINLGIFPSGGSPIWFIDPNGP